MNREDILAHAKKTYGTDADYPWGPFPKHAILRHKNNGKWYAALITIAKDRLGLEGEGNVELLNVKCEPEMIGSLRTEPGILPAYHMNKAHWISILLDGPLGEDQITGLLGISYDLTKE